MKKTFTLFVLFLITIPHGYGQKAFTYAYTQPKDLGDGWETAHIKSITTDTLRLYQLFNQLQNGKNKVHSVLLIKDGTLVIEEYFNDHEIAQPHDLRSVTKSIRSLLLGIAMDKGFVKSLDDPITDYIRSPIPQKNLGEGKNKITIAHLLTMSSGLDCNDWDKRSKGQEDKVYQKKDWLQYTLDLPMIHEPGTVSTYCSMGTVLLAELISQASGMPIDKFAQEYIFNPLGITTAHWGHTTHKKVIPSGKRLYMTPRDMAKIGQLVLQNGQWNGQQLISSQWIRDSSSPKTKIAGMEYGYLWWPMSFSQHSKELFATVATGNGGQYIMVFPEIQLVAVFTGGAYNSQEDKLAFAIMKDIFLPLVVPGT